MSCLTQLDHTGVLVSDFERSKEFYMDFLGMDLRRDSSDLDPAIGTPNVQVKSGDCVLFMFRNLKPGESKDIRPGPAPHFEFTVSDADAAARYLSKSGFAHDGPVATPAGYQRIYFRDPDDNILSFSMKAAGAGNGKGIDITGFGAINLPAADLEDTTKFYVDVLGMEVCEDRMDLNANDSRQEFRPYRLLKSERTSIALCPVWKAGDYERICRDGQPLALSPRSRTRVLHFAFRSKDREAMLKKFDAMKFPYEVYEGRGKSGYEVYLHDPSGFRIEIVGH
jgi:catechol 2,3-dioxygenase-like lactoylglutathione lyase family enzyme